MKFIYTPKDKGQLKWRYARINIGGGKRNEFRSFDDFSDWYQEQGKVCHFCGLLEAELQELVLTGKVQSKRFPENGQISWGRARGVWLEIDRLDWSDSYSRDNCVLSCYFCTNDKSDVFDGRTYVLFFQNRAGYLRNLLKQNVSAE